MIAYNVRSIGTFPGPVFELGAITVLRGTASGITGMGARRYSASDLGAETTYEGAGFGCGLAG